MLQSRLAWWSLLAMLFVLACSGVPSAPEAEPELESEVLTPGELTITEYEGEIPPEYLIWPSIKRYNILVDEGDYFGTPYLQAVGSMEFLGTFGEVDLTMEVSKNWHPLTTRAGRVPVQNIIPQNSTISGPNLVYNPPATCGYSIYASGHFTAKTSFPAPQIGEVVIGIVTKQMFNGIGQPGCPADGECLGDKIIPDPDYDPFDPWGPNECSDDPIGGGGGNGDRNCTQELIIIEISYDGV